MHVFKRVNFEPCITLNGLLPRLKPNGTVRSIHLRLAPRSMSLEARSNMKHAPTSGALYPMVILASTGTVTKPHTSINPSSVQT